MLLGRDRLTVSLKDDQIACHDPLLRRLSQVINAFNMHVSTSAIDAAAKTHRECALRKQELATLQVEINEAFCK